MTLDSRLRRQIKHTAVGLRRSLVSACILALLVSAGSAQQSGRRLSAELELELARTRQLYVVVDVAGSSLDLRVRGMVLDRTPLSAVAIAAPQPLLGRRSWPELELPVLWRVSEPPAAEWRRLVAPAELRQYSESPEEHAASVQTPVPDSAAVPEPPASYCMAVDSGWQLLVSQGEGLSLWRRSAEAIADGWARWTGRDRPPRPPRLVLSVPAADARRLLHIFRGGLPILVVSGEPRPAAEGGQS